MIHKRENYATNTIINNLVDKGCGVVVFGTSLVRILIINIDANGPLFLSNHNDIGNPFLQWDRINEARFQ
jgi:hypothetical protein